LPCPGQYIRGRDATDLKSNPLAKWTEFQKIDLRSMFRGFSTSKGKSRARPFILSLSAATLLLYVALASQAQTSTAESPAETDRVHFGDLVDVDVIGSFEYDWRGTVNPEGFLDGMDRLEDPIFALCRTESDVAGDIIKAYSTFLRNPQVIVRIVDRSRRAEAIVSGAVRTPYRFQIRRPVRLNELIILAGGVTDRSSGEISIFRPQSLSCTAKPLEKTEAFVKASSASGSQTLKIMIQNLLKGAPEANPEIRSGDIVTVLEAAPIYVIGGVNNPRQISSRSQTTLERAIASSGGLAKDAVKEKIQIYRRINGQTKIIEADLGKIEAKTLEDIPLLAYDIVDVGQKGRGKRRFPPNVDGGTWRNDRFSLRLRIID
jgi:protein involved in polysaccharide export with SLBB domain